MMIHTQSIVTARHRFSNVFLMHYGGDQRVLSQAPISGTVWAPTDTGWPLLTFLACRVKNSPCWTTLRRRTPSHPFEVPGG